MNSRFNNGSRPSNSSSSCRVPEGGYQPYMLGGSYASGGTAACSGIGAPYRTNSNRRETMRDCMEWPGAGNASRVSGGNNYYQQGMSYGGSKNYIQPKAFVSMAGSGEGQGGVTIPVQIAPSGTNPASLIKPMEPITLRVNAPQPSDGGRGPIRFTLSPEQIYGRMQ